MNNNSSCPSCGLKISLFKCRKHMYCSKCNAELKSNSLKIGLVSVILGGLICALAMSILAPYLAIEDPLLVAKLLTLPAALFIYYLAVEFGMLNIRLSDD